MIFIFFCAKGFNWDTGPHKQFYCDTCPVCGCTSPPVWLTYFQVKLTPGRRLLRANIAELGWLTSGPPILSLRLVRAQQDTLSLCQFNSNQPPFKLLAVSQSGRSAPPHPRLQGLIRSRPQLHRDPCWCLGRRRHGGGGGRCWSCAWRMSPTSR